jgi:hypothetical protein
MTFGQWMDFLWILEVELDLNCFWNWKMNWNLKPAHGPNSTRRPRSFSDHGLLWPGQRARGLALARPTRAVATTRHQSAAGARMAVTERAWCTTWRGWWWHYGERMTMMSSPHGSMAHGASTGQQGLDQLTVKRWPDGEAGLYRCTTTFQRWRPPAGSTTASVRSCRSGRVTGSRCNTEIETGRCRRLAHRKGEDPRWWSTVTSHP